jgi:cobyrinic acid a,c-diamide synthase
MANTDLTDLTTEVEFFALESGSQKDLIDQALLGTRIIIIRDRAFSFIYAANIAFLEQAGAELVYCSALADAKLPDGDILYIPGGYPELYAEKLMTNVTFLRDIRDFAATKKTIIAECGGMLYLLDHLIDMSDQKIQMLGLIPGNAVMQKKLASIGSQWVDLSSFEKEIAEAGDDRFTTANNTNACNNIMRGHSFHYSRADIELEPRCQTTHHPSERAGEYVYLHNNILASYMHWYFPSNPKLTLKIFDKKRSFEH